MQVGKTDIITAKCLYVSIVGGVDLDGTTLVRVCIPICLFRIRMLHLLIPI